MAHRLILIRHAKSSWDDFNLSDHERPLNKRGRASASAIGQWLQRKGYLPDEIQSSDSARTRETCARLELSVPVTFTGALYHAGASRLLAQLQGMRGKTVALVAHNPGIGDFAERIVSEPPDHPRFFDYPTCATLVADFDIDAWGQAQFGMARVVDFVIPRELTGD